MKLIRVWLCLVSVIAIMLCSSCSHNRTDDATLVDRGTELVKLMQELAQSDYVNQTTTSSDLLSQFDPIINGNYNTPLAVYRIRVGEEFWATLLGETDFDKMSADLQDAMHNKMFASVASVVNSRMGSNAIAAAALCTAQDIFADPTIDETTLCLFVYENAPAAMICFTVGDDHAVVANGTFVFDDKLQTTDIATIESQLLYADAQVEKIQ